MGGAAAERLEGLDWPVELDFVDALGAERRVTSSSCSGVRFEDVRPVRSFQWSPGLEHFPGWWWAATTGRHVGYESWLERDHVQALDFDREIMGIASQPFWLRWEGERGWRRHAPDYFARRVDGTGVVVDVRADDRIEDRDAEAFAVTARLCALVGWEFRRVGEIDPVLRANVRWLSRYRHPRCAGRSEVGDRLREVFVSPAPLLAGAEEVGDRLAVLPALFHLMWQCELIADLEQERLGPATLVRAAWPQGGRR
ncbi:TnsA-like heteromeric transposase endonuclease subunit [Nonomuraea sp. MG754425]|uniref:TnsA-like heteromeric transposase endonuclease subunit n=1 Tax=Nonomuraea sp. MG754425 TaxID=2570319 RepID=UPI001F305470|nr:TnsA-like heteromeric transposase endonuclease subunit [Nonomuraea sp. MG754425]MCF6475865.1 TnsA-like heteromeric transposase endonuclease subunit [Nonomuraea sp. MG754425]